MIDEINSGETYVEEIILPTITSVSESDGVFNASREIILRGDQNKIICQSQQNEINVVGDRNTIYGKANHIVLSGKHNCASGTIGAKMVWIDDTGEHVAVVDGQVIKEGVPYCFDGKKVQEVVRNAKITYAIKDKAQRCVNGEYFESGLARALYETNADYLFMCIDGNGMARWSKTSYEDAAHKVLRDREILKLSREQMILAIKLKGVINGAEFKKLYGCCEQGVRWFADRCHRKGYCESFVCDNGVDLATLADILTEARDALIRMDEQTKDWIDGYLNDFAQ